MQQRQETSIRALIAFTKTLRMEEEKLAEERQLFGEGAEAKQLEQERRRMEIVSAAERKFANDMTDLTIERLKKTPELARQAIDAELVAISSRLQQERAMNETAY